MPLIFPQAPSAAVAATREKLQEMSARKQFSIAALAMVQPQQIDLASPHPVYNVGLDDLIASKPLSSLGLTSWRFIVKANGKEEAAAEAQDSHRGSLQFASVNSGPFVAGTVAALNSLSADPTVADGHWEVRVIRIPALFVMAIWLHKADGSSDVLRVTPPVRTELDGKRFYSWPEMVAALKDQARQRLAADDGTKG